MSGNIKAETVELEIWISQETRRDLEELVRRGFGTDIEDVGAKLLEREVRRPPRQHEGRRASDKIITAMWS